MSQQAPHHAVSPTIGPTTAPTWTTPQLARLESEWGQLRRAFAYHPFVEIIPLSGDPPAEYQVTYKVTTLAIDDAGQLAYVTSCPVHVWLPPQFPHNAPVVRPMAAAFHPNVAMEWVHLNPAWRPDASLVDVVSQVGFLLAFQSYDPNAVANPVAMNWVFANPHLLPTDPAANFFPGAGDEPLARISRFGPDTIADFQHRLEEAVDRLVSAGPAPDPVELEQLARETAAVLAVFGDAEVPEHLRSAAAEVREMAASVREPNSVWAQLGRQLVTAQAVAAAAGALVTAEESVRRAMATDSTRQVAHPTPGPHAGKAAEGKSGGAAGRVPASASLQPLSLALRRAVHDADGAVADLRERLAQLAALPRPSAATGAGTLLSRRLGRELSRLSAATEPARAAGAWLASLEPILHRARHESAAADRVAAWAEHRDLLRRGRELVARVKATPPAELQAYFTEGAGGKAGPFDFEKRVDPGDGGPALAVSNLRAAIVRVVDVETEEVIGRGDGRVVVTRAGAPGGATLSVTVGEHTDELRVQLEYLLTQLRDAMTRLRPPEDESAPPGGPSTWVARLAVDLDAPDAQHEAREEHRRASDEWKHVLAELAALGRYKQRLATYHLATRLIAFAPRVTAEGDRLRASLSRADARLAEIGARSTRDAESDRLIIPSQYAGEYAQHLADRDAAQQQIQRLQLALDGGVERLKLRLSKPRLFGSADLPHLRLLGGLPETYAAQQPQLGDAALAELVGRLEALLGRAVAAPPIAPAGAEEATPPDKHGVTEVPADSNPPVPTSRPTQP